MHPYQLTGIAFIIFFLAWVTHVIVTIQTEAYLLLLAGGFIFPIGVIHGIGIWLGVF